LSPLAAAAPCPPPPGNAFIGDSDVAQNGTPDDAGGDGVQLESGAEAGLGDTQAGGETHPGPRGATLMQARRTASSLPPMASIARPGVVRSRKKADTGKASTDQHRESHHPPAV